MVFCSRVVVVVCMCCMYVVVCMCCCCGKLEFCLVRFRSEAILRSPVMASPGRWGRKIQQKSPEVPGVGAHKWCTHVVVCIAFFGGCCYYGFLDFLPFLLFIAYYEYTIRV